MLALIPKTLSVDLRPASLSNSSDHSLPASWSLRSLFARLLRGQAPRDRLSDAEQGVVGRRDVGRRPQVHAERHPAAAGGAEREQRLRRAVTGGLVHADHVTPAAAAQHLPAEGQTGLRRSRGCPVRERSLWRAARWL